MFSRPRVDHLQARINVVDEDVRRLTSKRRSHPFDVAGRRHLNAEFGVDLVEQPHRVGHEQAARELVVFCLRDEVSREMGRVS